ncbi:MAG: 50S ribosomal protein L30 [Geminicoccaceae bacterium]
MSTGQIRVTQTRSAIGRPGRQRQNLIGLGLNKIARSRVWPDTPSVRGRINQVKHLVSVEPVGEQPEPARPRKSDEAE